MSRIFFFVIFGLGGAGILISLGTWQVQRLAWKQGLLAEIEARATASPRALTPELVADADNRYSPVKASGVFLEGYLRVLASRKTIGPVYRIIRPFQSNSIGKILVDTGWQRTADAVAPAPMHRVQIKGNLDRPQEIDQFTPDPDVIDNFWFARDVDAMAQMLGVDPVLMVLSEAPQVDLGVTPWPVETGNIPNNHLQYAITWFSLAAIWLAMTAYFLTRGPRAKTE
ncbi:SURF1 family protein [Ascidiaceihabitans sp.]|uniref:SURF1 family protein n=1 Tax=Ascidiaceihabitans sp. TaxID=1872644 RepID=UPI003299FD60